MSEPIKTAIYVGVAVAALGAAYLGRPRTDTTPTAQTKLFAEFTDPETAAHLKIIRYGQSEATLETFEVGRDSKGRWTIPSHAGYPADAENQMRDVALSLLDLDVIRTASERAEDHAEFGVIEPDPERLSAGDKGVGILVDLRDDKDKELVKLIIGNEVREAEGQRYVRVRGQDPVYVVKVDPTKLTTEFQDWIEKDLLKISTFNVESLRLKDYSIRQALRNGRAVQVLDQRYDIHVRYDSGAAKWMLQEMLTYSDGQVRKESLAELEEVDSSKLNSLKTALGDFKIVDVRRKPTGLGADLTAGKDFLDDTATVEDLAGRGFLASGSQDDEKINLWSNNGEVHVGMKDGVEYVLRFGASTGTESKTGLNRYLFVTARLDESKIPEPVLQEVPKPTDQLGPKANTSDPAEGADKDSPDKDSPDSPDGTKADQDEEKAQRDKEIERIEKENQKKIDEYNDKKKKSRETVNELNARFAPWYYVIADDVYKKVHLGRKDIIKESAKAETEGFQIDAFRKLQADGPAAKSSSTEPPKGDFDQE